MEGSKRELLEGEVLSVDDNGEAHWQYQHDHKHRQVANVEGCQHVGTERAIGGVNIFKL